MEENDWRRIRELPKNRPLVTLAMVEEVRELALTSCNAELLEACDGAIAGDPLSCSRVRLAHQAHLETA